MIAEPYICTKGLHAGDIQWLYRQQDGRLIDLLPRHNPANLQFIRYGGNWQPYADFEREKLKAMGYFVVEIDCWGYVLRNKHGAMIHHSQGQIGYSWIEYQANSESSRLLKRAEFLKAVCEKEGVEWLPKGKCNACGCCLCPCHR